MAGIFGGGKSENVTTTSRVELTPEQRQIISMGVPHLQEFAANPPTLPEGSGVAGRNAIQGQAEGMALGAALGQGELANTASQFNQFLLGDALSPETNPALQAHMEAAARPITQNLTEQILPQIRHQFVDTGYGSTRQGIAEGIASRGALDAIASSNADIANKGYQSGLDAAVKGLGLIPQTQSSQLAPAVTTGAVGDVRQQQEQTELTDARNRQTAEQTLPLSIGNALVSAAAGIPGAASSVSQPAPTPNILGSALGGASLGAGLFPSLSMAGPAGAGIGALLALL